MKSDYLQLQCGRNWDFSLLYNTSKGVKYRKGSNSYKHPEQSDVLQFQNLLLLGLCSLGLSTNAAKALYSTLDCRCLASLVVIKLWAISWNEMLCQEFRTISIKANSQATHRRRAKPNCMRAWRGTSLGICFPGTDDLSRKLLTIKIQLVALYWYFAP